MRGPIKVLRKSDPWLLVSTVALLSVGILMVFSTTARISQEQFGSATFMVGKHFLHVLLGLVLFSIVLTIDVNSLKKHAPKLIIVSVVLLVLVLVPGLGKSAGGAQRWVGFGSIRVQPGEFVKVFILIYMAYYIDRYKSIMSHFVPGIVVPFAILGGVGLLFLLQPDFGSVVVVAFVVIAERLQLQN